MRVFVGLACAFLVACGGGGSGSGSVGQPDDAGTPVVNPLDAGSGGGTPDAGPAGTGADAGPVGNGADAGGPTRFALQVAINGQGTVVSTPSGIDCGNACAASFDSGTAVTLTPQPAPGFRFDGWGGACTGPSSCLVTLTADAHVFATFVAVAPQQHVLSVTLTGTGAGAVSSSPSGISCGASCSAGFDDGSTVTLTAVAGTGSVFAGWGGACTGAAACVVTMGGDRQVSARFDPAAPPQPTTFAVKEIPGAEGDSELSPTSVNGSGDVVGTYSLSLSTAHAFLFDAASGTTQRIAADSSDVQAAAGINSSRQVAIDTGLSTTVQQRAFRWQAGVEISIGALPPGPNGPQTNANAINEQGWIVGWSLSSANWERAVLWDGVTLHDLGSLANTFSVANAVNFSGVAVGTTSVLGDTTQHGAVFMSGTITDLGADVNPLGINGNGRIVGSSRVAGQFHAFVFDLPNGPLRDVSPAQACSLSGVNDGGDAVGGCGIGDPANRTQHATLWRGGAMIDLNDLITDPSWILESAVAVNASGQIVGTGIHNGNLRAFILTPQ